MRIMVRYARLNECLTSGIANGNSMRLARRDGQSDGPVSGTGSSRMDGCRKSTEYRLGVDAADRNAKLGTERIYSAASARAGDTAIARRAGTIVATSPTPNSATTTAASVNGSCGVTP